MPPDKVGYRQYLYVKQAVEKGWSSRLRIGLGTKNPT